MRARARACRTLLLRDTRGHADIATYHTTCTMTSAEAAYRHT